MNISHCHTETDGTGTYREQNRTSDNRTEQEDKVFSPDVNWVQ